jgi:hypothetical protein
LALQRLERAINHTGTQIRQRRHDSAGGVFEGGTLGALQRSGQLENQRIQLPVSGMNALAIRPWMAGVFCYFKRDMTKASC